MEKICWKQRFINFNNAVNQLKRFINHGKLNEFEVQGFIHCFEYTFELAWKTTKDYLEEEGFMVASPREAIKIANGQGILNGEVFLDALKKRNLMAHTYSEEIIKLTENLIRNTYSEEIFKLHSFFEGNI